LAVGILLALYVYFSSVRFTHFVYIRGSEHAARKRISCGLRSIQARPAVLNFLTFICCLFLLMNNFFRF